MKTFHVLPRSVFDLCHSHFMESHYIDLVDGDILVCCEFKSLEQCDKFKNNPMVKTLPHPLSGGTVYALFQQKHLDYLKSLGVNVLPTDSSWDLSEKIKTVNRLVSLD